MVQRGGKNILGEIRKILSITNRRTMKDNKLHEFLIHFIYTTIHFFRANRLHTKRGQKYGKTNVSFRSCILRKIQLNMSEDLDQHFALPCGAATYYNTINTSVDYLSFKMFKKKIVKAKSELYE